MHLSSKSLDGVLDDMDILDDAGDGVRVLKISLGSSTESFIKIQHQKPSEDYTYPPSLLLESWRTGMFLMELEMVSGVVRKRLFQSHLTRHGWFLTNHSTVFAGPGQVSLKQPFRVMY